MTIDVYLYANGNDPFTFGCGSFEVSCLCCEDVGLAVFGVVDAFVLAAQVIAPVVLEVSGGEQGAELEDSLGAFEAPAGSCDVHSVLDQPSCRSLDDSCRDGPAFGEGGVITEVVLLVVEVAGALVGAGSFGAGVAVGGGTAADSGRDLRGLSPEDLAGPGGDPVLGGRLAFIEERPGSLP
jgi:hypothetical protein